MTDYYVRQSGGSGSGTSYAAAWNTLGGVNWGSITAGNTLYICGALTGQAANWGPTSSGTSLNPITISGDPSTSDDAGNIPTVRGSVAMTAFQFRIDDKSYITLTSLDMTHTTTANSCVVTAGSFSNFSLIDVSLQSDLSRGYGALWATGNVQTDILIDGCNFSNNGLEGLKFHAYTASQTGTLSRFIIRNSTFNNNGFTSPYAAGIHIETQSNTNALCVFSDMLVENCVANNNGTFGITFRDLHDNPSSTSSRDVVVRNCTTNENGLGSLEGSGGGINLNGIGTSDNDFGLTSISGNTCNHNYSLNGGTNDFYCDHLIIEDNDCSYNTINPDRITPIDGNGILIDLGCSNIIIRDNNCDYNLGIAGLPAGNSGCAIMILGGTNIDIHNNTGIGNRCGMFVGLGDGNTNINWHNNTFLECFEYLISVPSSTTDADEHTIKNNVLTGTGSQYYIENDATPDVVMGNNIFWNASGGYLSQTDPGTDSYVDPQLSVDYFPAPQGPCIGSGATLLSTYDFHSRPKVGSGNHIGAKWPKLGGSSVRRKL